MIIYEKCNKMTYFISDINKIFLLILLQYFILLLMLHILSFYITIVELIYLSRKIFCILECYKKLIFLI